ncbi:MAG TPA: hypothetical protein VLT87_31315 [Thermoanaerobaculia bacterium]|nr:hypothetical protein [Thermoanaerobaculia bacterium]
MKPVVLKLATVLVSSAVALGLAELVARRAYGEGFRMLVDAREDHSYRPLLDYEQTNAGRLLVVLYPWPQMLYTRDDPAAYAVLRRTFPDFYADRELVFGTRPSPAVSEYQARMGRFCRERGLPVLDLVPVFQQDSDWIRLYIPGDVHWNERGCRLVGARIAREVERLLPAP